MSAERAFPWWGSLTSSEAEALAAADPVVVLPLGAVEQHGPHLPLATDLHIGLGLLERALRHLPDGFPLAVLPPQPVGASAEHARFPGTLSLEPALLAEVVHAHGRALARMGVRRLVLAGSHGGNRHVEDAAALRLREEHGMLVVKAAWYRFPRPGGLELPEGEWRHGLHAGALETAMMLALRPELVRTERAADAPSLGGELEATLRRVGPTGEAPFAWLAGDLHPSGAAGDATLADADLGERLVEHYGRVLADVLQDARDFPLDRLA